tara:strand:+ start:4032 stop:4547 length:516 start_codon:yes stop_codon:yes gene_type:complete
MPKNNQLDRVIRSRHIETGNVATADIADDAVTNAKLGALQPKTLLYEYDIGIGGTVATHNLTAKGGGAPTQIPDNAVITNVTIEVITALGTASGTATVTIGTLGGPNDPDGLVTAINHSATPFDAANSVLSGTPTIVSGKTTAANGVTMTIGSNALNAGKFYVWVSYFEGA